MASLRKKWKGLVFCLLLAVPSRFLGKVFPITGGAVIVIITGMAITVFMKSKDGLEDGIRFTSEKVLQWVITLPKFGMNSNIVLETGKQPLPTTTCTITTSLVIAFVLHKPMHIPFNISTLAGVGSSIYDGSAIATAAPVISADDDKVAQAIPAIPFFNVLAAILFPTLDKVLGFDTVPDNAFGILVETVTNDISFVTAAAATWDNMWNLGAAILDKAVTAELTRTLAIVPTTLCLAFIQTRGEEKENRADGQFVNFKNIFPFPILCFIRASVITTIAMGAGTPASAFVPIKELSKFFTILVTAVVGLNTGPAKLIRTDDKPMLMGVYCWVGITAVSLELQSVLGIW